MDNILLFGFLFLGGTLGQLLLSRSGDLGNLLFSGIRDKRGEAPTGGAGEGKGGEGVSSDMKFSPEQQQFIDKLIDRRVGEIKSRYSDYDDLRKFKSENDKQQEAKVQRDLEEQKKYDEAKKGYENTINQHKELVGKKDQEIVDLRISHSLLNEISRQNGYPEETLALLKSSAMLDGAGNVVIKGKDSNGIDTQLSVAEGIKRFLESRPYLVKSTHKAGGGTPPGTPPQGGNGSGAGEDHNSLNREYMDAISRGDFKRSRELKIKINQILYAKGVSI